MIKAIISGGQTGADRAALDFAIQHGIAHGGWIPKGRRTEDGPLPAQYNLREIPSRDYAKRTQKNILEAGGTLILSHGSLKGGSALTKRLSGKYHKPCLHIDLDVLSFNQSALVIAGWLRKNFIAVLNVAGPRASEDPLIYEAVVRLLELTFNSELKMRGLTTRQPQR